MTRRLAIAEVVRALAVLALVFLNFAHVPAAAASAYGASAVMDAGSYCGDPPDGGKTPHAPCHACRIGGGADVPPPCPGVRPRLDAGVRHYGAVESFAPLARRRAGVSARSPPAA